MKFYAACVDMTEADHVIFATLVHILRVLPDMSFDTSAFGTCPNQVTCHNICHAFAKLFPLEVEDGYFTTGYQHSWLRTASGTIIDAYPVAGASPFMVSGDRMSPWSRLYTLNYELRTKLLNDAIFQHRTKLVTEAIQFQLMQTQIPARR